MKTDKVNESAGGFEEMKSDQLLEIWRAADVERYSEEEFGKIRKILEERGFYVGDQVRKLEGLTGWLLIPRIVLIPLSLIMVFGMWTAILINLFVDTAGDKTAAFWLIPLTAVLTVVSLAAAYLFYNKHRKAPAALIILLSLLILVPLLAGFYGMFFIETFRPVAWTIMMCIVGIPSVIFIFYLQKSVRVRRTFTKG